MGLPSDRAAGFRPPSQSNKNSLSLTAATASAATATESTATQGKKWISMACDQNWKCTFSDNGTNTITDPTTSYPFAAGAIVSFELNAQNTHFKAIAAANATLLWWLSSRE